MLTTGFWPTFKQTEVALPAELTRCQAVFREYYDTITSHRRLTWIHSLGNATVGSVTLGFRRRLGARPLTFVVWPFDCPCAAR